MAGYYIGEPTSNIEVEATGLPEYMSTGAQVREASKELAYRGGMLHNFMVSQPWDDPHGHKELLTPEQATRDYYVPGMTPFMAPVHPDVARQQYEEFLWRKKQQDILSRASGEFGSGSVAQFASQMLGSIKDLPSTMLAFIPVVGETKYAEWLAKAGGLAGRTAVRAGVGAAEGAVGGALAESVIAPLRMYNREEVTASDVIANVGMSAAMGATLRAGGGALLDGWNAIKTKLPGASLEANTIATGQAIDAAREGRPVNVANVIEATTTIEQRIRRKALEERIAFLEDLYSSERTTPGVKAWAQDEIEKLLARESKVGAEESYMSAPGRAEQQAVEPGAAGLAKETATPEAPREQPTALQALKLPEDTQAELRTSKVTTPDGKPLVVFHASSAAILEFDAQKLGFNTGAASAREGFFFAGKPSTAEAFLPDGGHGAVYPVMLNMKNPMIFDQQGAMRRPRSYVSLIAEAKAKGHDGLIIKNTYDVPRSRAASLSREHLDNIYVAFNAKQIVRPFSEHARVGASAEAVKGHVEVLAAHEKLQLSKEEIEATVKNHVPGEDPGETLLRTLRDNLDEELKVSRNATERRVGGEPGAVRAVDRGEAAMASEQSQAPEGTRSGEDHTQYGEGDRTLGREAAPPERDPGELLAEQHRANYGPDPRAEEQLAEQRAYLAKKEVTYPTEDAPLEVLAKAEKELQAEIDVEASRMERLLQEDQEHPEATRAFSEGLVESIREADREIAEANADAAAYEQAAICLMMTGGW